MGKRRAQLMLKKNDSVTFLATRNPAESRAFYEDKIGLTLISEEHFALMFDLKGHRLRITKVNELTPAKHTVLGWHVSDVAAMIRHLMASGVVFEQFDEMDQDQLGMWTSPSGAKVAWFKDPDGNSLSITQDSDSNIV